MKIYGNILFTTINLSSKILFDFYSIIISLFAMEKLMIYLVDVLFVQQIYVFMIKNLLLFIEKQILVSFYYCIHYILSYLQNY